MSTPRPSPPPPMRLVVVGRPGSASRPQSAKRDYERAWTRTPGTPRSDGVVRSGNNNAVVTTSSSPRAPVVSPSPSGSLAAVVQRQLTASAAASSGREAAAGEMPSAGHQGGGFLRMFEAANGDMLRDDATTMDGDDDMRHVAGSPEDEGLASGSGSMQDRVHGQGNPKTYKKHHNAATLVDKKAQLLLQQEQQDNANELIAFQQIMSTLTDEVSSFSSFTVACDAALSRAEAFGDSQRWLRRMRFEATASNNDRAGVDEEGDGDDATLQKELQQAGGVPTQLETSVAAALLLKLTPHLGGFGLLVHRLVMRLISGTFLGIPAGVACSSAAKPPTETDFVNLMKSTSFSTKCAQLDMVVKEKTESLKSTKATLFANSAIFFRMAGKHSSDRLQRVFTAWRQAVRKKRLFETHFAKLRAIQLDRELKRECFLRWSSGVHAIKASRTTSLSAANHDRMHSRLTDLNSRCAQREDQLGSQRAAKEKFAARCDRLEELYAFEKEELAKCRTRLLSCEQEITRFRTLSATVVYAFDRLTSVIPLLHFSPAMVHEVTEASVKRDLNIRRGAAAPVHPHSSVSSPSNGVSPSSHRGGARWDDNDDAHMLSGSLSGHQLPYGSNSPHRHQAQNPGNLLHPKLHITEEYHVPFVVHGGGASHFEEYVDDVYMSVIKWLNFAKDEARQFVEGLRVQQFGFSKDPFAFSLEDNDILRAFRDSEVVSRPIRDLSRDLHDGRVYQLILWRLISHRFGGTWYLTASNGNAAASGTMSSASTASHGSAGNGSAIAPPPIAPYVACESTVDRLKVVIKLAKFIGIDAGVTLENLMESNAHTAKSTHFLLCSRIMSVQSEYTPHFWALQGSRTNASGPGSPSKTTGAQPNSLAAAVDNFAATSSGLTTAHLLQVLQSASQRLDALERWRAIVRNIENFAAQVATGAAQLDTGSHRSPFIMRDLLVERETMTEQIPPQSLRFAKPLTNRYGQPADVVPSMGRSAVGMSQTFLSSVRSPTGGDSGSAVGGAGGPQALTRSTANSRNEWSAAEDHSSSYADGGNAGDEFLLSSATAIGTPRPAPPPSGPSAIQAAVSFLWAELNHVLAQNANEVQLVQWYYAAKAGLDVVEFVWDTPAWFLFIYDAKININKHVPKTVSDAVFRTVAASNPQSVRTAIASLQPAVLQQRMSMVGGGTSVRKPHHRGGDDATSPSAPSAPNHAAGGTANATAAGDDDGQGGSIPYQMNIRRFPSAVVRLFLARSLNPASQNFVWQDVDRAVECFREFMSTVVLAPSVGRSQVGFFLKTFIQPAVQDVLRVNKEHLRRIFTELGTRDPATQLTRIRKESFVHFVTRDLKTLSPSASSSSVAGAPAVSAGTSAPDAGDVVGELYHVCRLVSSVHNPMLNKPQATPAAQQQQQQQQQLQPSAAVTTQPTSIAAYVAGLDLVGFQVALMLLSRVKHGFPLVPHEIALQQYLTTVVLPVCQFKFKLKF